MQFILIAYDRTDSDAFSRRLKARPEHLEKIKTLKISGEFIFGGAILNESGNMIGSMILYEMPDRETLDKRLEDEPYINAGVWEKVDIRPFRLAAIETGQEQKL